jgi:hypothetical protein
MLTLSDAIPREHFREMFELVTEKVIATNVGAFYVTDTAGASTTNLFVWDEGVSRGVVADGEEMRKYHPKRPKQAYKLTRDRIGEEPFQEVFCTSFFNEHSKQKFFGKNADFAFAQIDLVRCFPNDIHISDLTLLDLTQPLIDRSLIAPRSHRGLHVFPMLLEGLKSVGRESGADRISLVAASQAAHEVFSRYGFRPTDTPVSQHAFKNFGHSHAMALAIT